MRYASVLALVVAGCAPAADPRPDSTDAAVYAAVLESFVPAGRTIVLVDSMIEIDSRDARGAKQLAGAEMARDLVVRSRERSLVPAELPTTRPFHRVRRRDLGFTEHGPNAEWLTFERRYPDAKGFFHLSGVGYDRNRTHAVVYVGHRCGELCGTTNLVMLALVAGRWKVVDTLVLATS